MEYHLDYGPGSPIPRQSVSLELNEKVFRSELAPCRTFLLRAEADAMLAAGVGRRVTPDNLLVIDRGGPLHNALRFEDEFARHKAVDVVGDLALVGEQMVGHIVAYRSGHRLNAELGRRVQHQAAADRLEVKQRVA